MKPLAYLRALLITVVLVWQGLAAMPTIKDSSVEEIYEKRRSRQEVKRWHRWVTSFGVDIEERELAALYVDSLLWMRVTRNRIIAPLQPLSDLTKTRQGWALFAQADEYPKRLVIDLEVEGEPVVYYRRSEVEPRLIRALLRNRRARGIIGYAMKRPRQQAFCQWVAGQVLDDQPQAEAVVVRREFLHTTLPGQPPDDVLSVKDICRVDREVAP